MKEKRKFYIIYDPVSKKCLDTTFYDNWKRIIIDDPNSFIGRLNEDVIAYSISSAKEALKFLVKLSPKLYPKLFQRSSTPIGGCLLLKHSWTPTPFATISKRRIIDRINLVELAVKSSEALPSEIEREDIQVRYRNAKLSFPKTGNKFKTKVKAAEQFIVNAQSECYSYANRPKLLDFSGVINGENFIFSCGEVQVQVFRFRSSSCYFFDKNRSIRLSYFACAKESLVEPKFELVSLILIDPVSFREVTPKNIEEYVCQ